ncbi:MAG TPA: GNAT family N-acetyltransferase [Scandinavium sp.]|jgi:GNAT superfamily N-acetyltransferase|uniref:GNAT family N-acetyltransferase n=1 Tax=Scandinavium sp. TaxID=2830653 RepID=UPI002E346795|nr:GNAT family N-acetyltransferase [Scandinavium sp.]HEX4502604.1 GNAT family N-acetyltransferase [Scandinavium sp.]
MTSPVRLISLSHHDILQRLPELADILVDCVNGGASVSFMQPFHPDKAIAFWQKVAQSVASNERVVLAAELADGQLVGTVQLITDLPENQPHRAEVAKLLVHSRGRRQGIARLLMDALEQEAMRLSKSVLVLDTATGSGAESFYQRCGWQKAGEIPRFALMPDGAMTATSVFYKFV